MIRLLFDGNYLFHKTFSIFSTYYKGQDMSLVLADTEKRQVLLRKCIIDMCHAIKPFENYLKEVTFVIDSHSWRYKIYPDYKYALTRVRDESYAGFLSCLDEFEALLRKKGVIVSRVEGAEGDDLLYIWSRYYQTYTRDKVVIITGDSDIRQLITERISVFMNNSKNLKFFCSKKGRYTAICSEKVKNAVDWETILPQDVEINVVNPFDILLSKVILGDSSDNIPKIKTGFGPKAFEKFCDFMKNNGYVLSVGSGISFLTHFIAKAFGEFTGEDEKQLEDKIAFNLHLVYLNMEVYDDDLLNNIIEDLNKQVRTYSYRGEYTLEKFYGMIINK